MDAASKLKLSYFFLVMMIGPCQFQKLNSVQKYNECGPNFGVIVKWGERLSERIPGLKAKQIVLTLESVKLNVPAVYGYQN